MRVCDCVCVCVSWYKKNPCISAYLFRLAIIYRMFSYQIYVHIAYVYLQIYCLLYIYVYVCMLWLLVRFLRYQIFIFPFVVYDYLTKLVLLHNIVSSSPPPPPARLLLRFVVVVVIVKGNLLNISLACFLLLLRISLLILFFCGFSLFSFCLRYLLKKSLKNFYAFCTKYLLLLLWFSLIICCLLHCCCFCCGIYVILV